MRYQIHKKYLIFPINRLASMKKVFFQCEDKTVYQLDMKLDARNPDFHAYVDVSRFTGKTLDISCEPEMGIEMKMKMDIEMEIGMGMVVTESDDMDVRTEFQESLRPQIHFTVCNGWSNDPNGLAYYNGQYYMFYQYNPCDVHWANMHWGLATSPDFVHWSEQDIALFPDEYGSIYSGSGIVDHQNLSGLGNGQDAPLLLYYTSAAAQPENYTQCLAYSVDNGRTFQKYDKNPIIPNRTSANRDPKVVWCEPLHKYLLAIYLEKDIYAFYTSEDLTGWEFLQQIELPEDNECPDIFPINVPDGSKKWVLMGAHDTYLVGEFQNGLFQPVQQPKVLYPAGINYAAQSFSGLDGRIVRIGWHRLNAPGKHFSQQMGVPCDLSFVSDKDGITLCARPVSEIARLYQEKNSWNASGFQLTPESDFVHAVTDSAQDIFLVFGHEKALVLLTVYGYKITIDTSGNKVRFENGTEIPLRHSSDDPQIRILYDRCSIEVFLDGGRICSVQQIFVDYNLPVLKLESNSEITVRNLSCHALDSIWS